MSSAYHDQSVNMHIYVYVRQSRPLLFADMFCLFVCLYSPFILSWQLN